MFQCEDTHQLRRVHPKPSQGEAEQDRREEQPDTAVLSHRFYIDHWLKLILARMQLSFCCDVSVSAFTQLQTDLVHQFYLRQAQVPFQFFELFGLLLSTLSKLPEQSEVTDAQKQADESYADYLAEMLDMIYNRKRILPLGYMSESSDTMHKVNFCLIFTRFEEYLNEKLQRLVEVN